MNQREKDISLQNKRTPSPSAKVSLEDYASVVGRTEIDELRSLTAPLAGKSVRMVNSTAIGGGVAEILDRLIPLLGDLELQARWDVITGGEDFFKVTKSFHNALHGSKYSPRQEHFDVFMEATEQNRKGREFHENFVVIHDPQPVGMVLSRNGKGNHWIWRCHIDVSDPHPEVWSFLEQFVRRYDAALFSSPSFLRKLEIPQHLFCPTIDPLAEKNRELAPQQVRQILERFNIDPERPIITQVSRFDRLKDPVGVVRAFQQVKKSAPHCQLVLAGGSATDDPEAESVLREVEEAAAGDKDIHILNLSPSSHLEINAIQRGSTLIVQKSLKEGFGLTIAEALWKKKPVVASDVGGIPLQVIHQSTGLLVHSVEETAAQISYLLSHPEAARRLGERGHDHVKYNFLITNKIKNYIKLFLSLEENDRRHSSGKLAANLRRSTELTMDSANPESAMVPVRVRPRGTKSRMGRASSLGPNRPS